MILEHLLGDVPVTAFIEGHYLKLPYARAGGCRTMTDLGNWAAIERALVAPGADVIVGRQGQRWDGTGPPSPEQARRLLGEGYTIGIRHAERHDPGLATLADAFRQDFRAPIDIHLYCTPVGQPGFGWHYDAEEVFVLQTQGEKEWELRKNTVHPWPVLEAIPADQRHERELSPLLRCTLKAGDWLYIPGGYWHRTRAGTESVSLSVGIRAPVALDILDFLRPLLCQSLLWRQRLPPGGTLACLSPDEAFRYHQELFTALGHDLAERLGNEEFVRAFLGRAGGGCPQGGD